MPSSHATWSSTSRVLSTLAIAEPYTAFEGGVAVVHNDIVGKVVLIGRALVPSGEHEGKNCFSIKALAAQNAGAVAVIFANNDEREPDSVMAMGSAGKNVTIPVLMVSYNGGAQIKNLGSGTSVELFEQ